MQLDRRCCGERIRRSIMSKLSIAAVMTLALSGVALTATSASAQFQGYGQRGYDNNNYSGKYNDGGLGRYCPPGYYPHSWPTGNGIRCEQQGGPNVIYNPAY